ncbi:MAG: type II toxin-antitoxin system Phd/YefM family antitoxin [Gallionellaceae bacterium]
MNIEIGSYEAKTKLPELLRGIQNGNRYTITLRGEPIADLVPSESAASVDAVSAVMQMKNFILNNKPVKGVDIRSLIDEGRE